MKVKELIDELKKFDENEEIYLRLRYIQGKSEEFFDFKIEENHWSFDDKKIVQIDSEVDIEKFILNHYED